MKDEEDIAYFRDTLQRIRMPIQSLSIDSWKNVELMHNLCEYLKLEDRFLVCDKDVLIEDNNAQMKDKND